MIYLGTEHYREDIHLSYYFSNNRFIVCDDLVDSEGLLCNTCDIFDTIGDFFDDIIRSEVIEYNKKKIIIINNNLDWHTNINVMYCNILNILINDLL